MDGFLIDTPKASYNCNTIEDLQLQLSHLRESKVSETKAHHLSATFQLPSTAVFHVPEEPEKDAQNHEPDHEPVHGSPSATPEAAVNENAQQPIREIRAHDALMNQSADDTALQRAVAKHIITSLGTVDGSFWSVRSMSRNATGWTFQYICKNSTLAWTRQHAKNTAKVLIGESSGKDGRDPINLARPAFDCRGSVTIAFVTNSRKITVKLEHTPLHKTVAELEEIFKPLLAPNRAVPAVRSAASKKKKSAAADGEEGAKKKRKKPDNPAADGQTEGQTPKPKKPRASKAKAKKKTVTPADGADDAMLNLSPSEAARRSDEAKRKLSDSGIDPATLSQEQFDIFANQSPELQHESLAMLVKYGAERLRIVHPAKDDGSSASPAGANGGTPEGSEKKKTSRKSLNPDGTPKIKKTRGGCEACKARKKKCTKGKPACNECIEDSLDCFYAPQQSRKLKGSKKKSREMAEDQPDEVDESAAAELPAGNSINLPENGTETIPAAAAMPEPEAEPGPVPEDEASDLGSPGFNSSHPPLPEIVSQEVETNVFPEVSHDMYQPGTSGLSYPPAVQDSMAAGMDYSQFQHQIGQQQNGQSGMAYPRHSQQASNASYHAPPPAPEPEPVETVQAPAQKAQNAPTTASRAAVRRSLPSGSAQSNNGYSQSSTTSNGSTWQTANAPASTSQAYTVPVSPRQSISGRQAAPVAAPVYDTSQSEALAAAATLSQAALRRTQPSPTARTVSPFQNQTQAAAQAARAKSRQGHRSQRRSTASPFQQTSSTPAAAVDTASMYNSTGSAEANSSASYDQYPRYNSTVTQSGQASSRAAYDAYPQQAGSNGSTASYTAYDSYNARSQASKSTPLKAPVTHSASASYTQTAGPSTSGWSNNNGTGHRSSNSYGSNNAAGSTNSAYNVPAASTQQQSASMQSFNVRPQPPAHASRTNTPSYSAQQQPAQQSRQRQQSHQMQPYNSYSSQSHSSSTQQPSQAQQQDWYGFGSSNNATAGYGSGSRGAGYGQSAQQRPAAMNISGSTYQQNMHDQEIYDMFRNPPGH